MVVKSVFAKRVHAAISTQTFGTTPTRPKSGYFSMHITYPDTKYEDPVDTTWAAGGNAHGIHFLIRTPQAGDLTNAVTGNGTNFFVIDLKRAAQANQKTRTDNAGLSATLPVLTYDLGTPEAARMIASAINSSRSVQTGIHGESRYLRAKYQKMSGAKEYPGKVQSQYGTSGIGAWVHPTTNHQYVRAKLGGSTHATMASGNVSQSPPSDIPQRGQITSNSGSRTFSYDSYKIAQQGSQGGEYYVDFHITHDTGGVDLAYGSVISVKNEIKEQHTVVVSWESDTPTGGGYWGTANGGPIIQGLGSELPVWYLTAKPMDGGNMGLPALNHESRGAIPIKDGSNGSNHSLQRGFSRFSIEGLNSCQLPDMPPPDLVAKGPTIMGHAAPVSRSYAYNDTSKILPIETPEHGTNLDKMGPYPSGVYHTSDMAANSFTKGGALLAGTRTRLSVVVPNNNLEDYYKEGDIVYNSNGDTIGTISEISSNLVSTTLVANGPRLRKTPCKMKSDNPWGGYTMPYHTNRLIITETAPTSVFQQGDELRTGTGTLMFTIDSAGNQQALRSNINHADYLSATPHPGIGLYFDSGGGKEWVLKSGVPGSGSFTALPDPTEWLIVGEPFLFKDASSTIRSPVGITIESIDVKTAKITLSAAPTGSDVPAAGEELWVKTITNGCVRCAHNSGDFAGAPHFARPEAADVWVDRASSIDDGVISTPTWGAANTRASYTKSDTYPLTFGDAATPYSANTGHNRRIGLSGDVFSNGTGTAETNFLARKNFDNFEALGSVTFGSTDYDRVEHLFNYSFGSALWGGRLYSSLGEYYGTAYVTAAGAIWRVVPDDGEEEKRMFEGTTIPGDTLLYRRSYEITLTANNAIEVKNGEELYFAKNPNKWNVAFENGLNGAVTFGEYKPNVLRNTDSHYGDAHPNLPEITRLSAGSTNANTGIQKYGHGAGSLYFNMPRPFRITRPINTERVKGLSIPNEEMVWDNITLTDDAGIELVLEGGSPFGTVIKDYKINKKRIDPSTGLITNVPSTPSSGIEPNMTIQLPSPEDIPGNIIVRSGHDRVQAWRNLSWGMGGLTEPRTQKNGQIEQNLDTMMDTNPGEATQFDTHDRVLHFHPVRILHDKMVSHFGLDLNNTPGSVPSGTTRLFAAHRLNDHVERGSVLLDTNNGADATYTHPHNRIRFGRQGHHFVAPLTTRGTPVALRRQLHRSHGSAYSLMFEAETENKHWGFQSASASQDATHYYLDTMDVKGEAFNTGSFSSDGFPGSESLYAQKPWHSIEHTDIPMLLPDILIAPGQEHTLVEGEYEQAVKVNVHTGTYSTTGYLMGKSDTAAYANANHGGPIGLQTATRTAVNRLNAGGEFCINGFILSQYSLMGGRPRPHQLVQSYHVIYGVTHGIQCAKGHSAGWIQPRVGTELATVPPLLAHDPELVNMAATPIPNAAQDLGLNYVTSNAHVDTDLTKADMALMKAEQTHSGSMPDAFLCTWLAEYSHPALLGTSREQYMTFRYRASGMPNATNYPATKGLLLRNADQSEAKTTGRHNVALPFERIYAFQWLQQYGYNGLNAGGHGTAWGTRGASAVLMGHSGIREPHGTLELPADFGNRRKSRGEGIGDGLNPRKTIETTTLQDEHSTDKPIKVTTTVTDPMVALDISRRLPVRAWGMRGASDAINMLAGDPAQLAAINTSQQAITNSARFDGGKHDTMNDMPTINDGADWNWPRAYTGVERTTPIGMVLSGHTAEGVDEEGFVRLSNDPWEKGEQKAGMGRVLGEEMNGMVSPRAMPAGVVDSVRTEYTTFTGADTKYLQAKPVNKGSDPIIGLNHHTGVLAKAAGSVDALTQTMAFESSATNFVHQKGNNLHLNAHPVDYHTSVTVGSSSNTDLIHDNFQHHFPAHGWGREKNMRNEGEAERAVLPIPLSEIADHRQVQSDMSPRLGIIGETHKMRVSGIQKDYIVTSTKAVSLHSDLAVGQQFPVMPSWVQEHGRTVAGLSQDDGSPIAVNYAGGNTERQPYGLPLIPNQDIGSKPNWCINGKTNQGVLTNSDSTRMVGGALATVRDHWAVRGSGDLPAWGGVFILRKTYLNRDENTDKTKVSLGDVIAGKPQHAQPVRKSVDYIVRMVRPLKVFGYTNAMNVNDGWLLGAMSSLTTVGFEQQPFTRDNRYGMFELNASRMGGTIRPIGSAYDKAPEIEWPDANDYNVVWHLIPSANMLQHFKADASRKDHDGNLNPSIDARYSQSTHPGGSEKVSQTETNYSFDSNTVLDPYPLRDNDANATKKQTSHAMTILGPRTTIRVDAAALDGGYLIVDDATGFPSSGTLIVIGKSGQYKYTSRTDTQFNLEFDGGLPPQSSHPATGNLVTDSSMVGAVVRYGTNLGTGVAIYAGANLASGSTASVTLSTSFAGGYAYGPNVGVLLANEAFSIGETLRTSAGVIGVIQSMAFSATLGKWVVTFTSNIAVSIDQNTLIKGTNSTWDSTFEHILPVSQSLVVAPSLVDNAVTIASYHTDKWDATDFRDTTDISTNIQYRGLGHYDPSDFTFLTPQRYVLSDGEKAGELKYIQKPGVGGLTKIYVDGRALSPDVVPPYLIDAGNKRWRIAGVVSKTGETNATTNYLQFRNLSADSLIKSGMKIKESGEQYVRLSHFMAIGVRSTDAALMILDDIDQTLPGADLIDYEIVNEQRITDVDLDTTAIYGGAIAKIGIPSVTSLSASMGAHPLLSASLQHSNIFVNRTSKGLFVMDVLRNLSQMDGYQLIVTKGGTLLYTKDAFFNKDRRIGSSSGPQLIEKSAMMEMANHIIVNGERIAENENILAEVKDNEKIKAMGGKGGDGLVRTLQQSLPGLRDRNLGIRLAKAFMRRTEQGAAIIKVQGLVKVQDLEPGEIVNVDFTMERIKGDFAVFEVTHDYSTGLTDLVIGQYEKGIEGLIADLQAATGEGTNEDSTRMKEMTEIVMTAPIKILSSVRIMTRMNNNTKFSIGAGWVNLTGEVIKQPLGNLGISGGKSGVIKNGAIGATSTTSIVVDGVDARMRFSVGDIVEVRNIATTSNTNPLTTNYDQWQYVGTVAAVPNANTITLAANNAVLIADNAELRVIHNRAKTIGHSKSVFYGVK